MTRTARVSGIRALAAAAAMAVASSVAGAVDIVEAWSRATPPGATTAVVYLLARNPPGAAPRSLMRIATPVAANVSLHASSVDAQGIARMWPVASLRLSPGETLRLSPGGRHFMLEGLKEPLKAGSRFPLEMQFDGGEAPVRVQVEVRELVPSAAETSGHDHHAH
jgi:periplasmic copper chaperone A